MQSTRAVSYAAKARSDKNKGPARHRRQPGPFVAQGELALNYSKVRTCRQLQCNPAGDLLSVQGLE